VVRKAPALERATILCSDHGGLVAHAWELWRCGPRLVASRNIQKVDAGAWRLLAMILCAKSIVHQCHYPHPSSSDPHLQLIKIGAWAGESKADMQYRVTVLGGGSFGLAMASILGRQGIPVTILVRKEATPMA
jgi:hypothetical protein